MYKSIYNCATNASGETRVRALRWCCTNLNYVLFLTISGESFLIDTKRVNNMTSDISVITIEKLVTFW